MWQSYKQERDCLMYFVRLVNTLLNDGESARNNHVLACNFVKYSPIFKLLFRLPVLHLNDHFSWFLNLTHVGF